MYQYQYLASGSLLSSYKPLIASCKVGYLFLATHYPPSNRGSKIPYWGPNNKNKYPKH